MGLKIYRTKPEKLEERQPRERAVYELWNSWVFPTSGRIIRRP